MRNSEGKKERNREKEGGKVKNEASKRRRTDLFLFSQKTEEASKPNDEREAKPRGDEGETETETKKNEEEDRGQTETEGALKRRIKNQKRKRSQLLHFCFVPLFSFPKAGPNRV